MIHEFQTISEAEAFYANPKAQDALRRAGMVGQPRIESDG